MASTKYATSAPAVRRPSLDDLSPMRSPVAADVLARTKRGRNHRGRRRCSNSASNLWLGTESYSAERTKEPASPNTTLLDEPEVVGTLRIVGRVRCASSDGCTKPRNTPDNTECAHDLGFVQQGCVHTPNCRPCPVRFIRLMPERHHA